MPGRLPRRAVPGRLPLESGSHGAYGHAMSSPTQAAHPSSAAVSHPRLHRFLAPEIVFGAGALGQLGALVGSLGGARILLVSDDGVQAAGWTERGVAALREAGLTVEVWDDVKPDPEDTTAERAAAAYRDVGADVIVGLGGGSVMDVAKGVAILGGCGGRIADYVGVDRLTDPLPPLVMVPTTGGTGADVSQFAVFTDPHTRQKRPVISRDVTPVASLIDPVLLTTMPAELTAETGFDALSHAVEAAVSRAASFLSTAHAREALHDLCPWLVRSQEHPGDLTAREHVARGSLQAGLAFSNAILGASHAISHQIGAALAIPHGRCNAVLLPHVMQTNAAADPAPFAAIATAWGLEGRPAHIAAQQAAGAVVDLADVLGLPARFRDLGVSRAALRGLVPGALEDACLATNPRPLDAAELDDLVARAW